MKTPATQAACMGSTSAKIVVALGLTLAISGMSMAPAFGEDNNYYRQGQQQRGTNGGYQHDQGHQRGHGDRQTYQRNVHRHGDYYGNQDYVYAPPPVVYAPEPEPGITLFLPLQFR